MRLTLRKFELLDDWYIIERHEEPGKHREWSEPTSYGSAFMHSARLSDADAEGSAAEMLDIATAIEKRRHESFKRCAVTFRGGMAYFYSPRNTNTEPEGVPLADADALAAEIRKTLGGGT